MKTFAWDIWFYCNYNCKFCTTKTKVFPEKIYKAEDFFKFWKNIYDNYGKCKICITGGEPLLYPNINLIISKLASIHYVHITTNLSMNIDFLSNKNIDRSNVFFNNTFHPCYDNIQCFIQKILKLKRYGYNLSICYMNSEFQLAEFLNYKKFFNGYGFDINLVSSVNLNNNYKLLKNFIDNNSISLYNNKDNGVIEKKNCNAGIDYACIDEFGNAYSCSVMKIKLGNIFNNNFNFLKEHINCNNICKIFENKY